MLLREDGWGHFQPPAAPPMFDELPKNYATIAPSAASTHSLMR